jgi:hypothetical protein
MLLERHRIIVVGGQRVPVSNEEKTLILVLQLYPVIEHSVHMAKMQATRRSHA